MHIRPTALVLALSGSLVGAALLAVVTFNRVAAAPPPDNTGAVPPALATEAPAPTGAVGAVTNPHGNLPPNHPVMGGNNPHAAKPAEQAAIQWKTPAAWKTAASASTMRIATYHVPPAPGAADQAELSVSRAGGTVEANAQRWVSQFEGGIEEPRVDRIVSGFKVTIVSIKGQYVGGGGAMAPSDAKPEGQWALVGAIVETPSGSYFFKLTGPAASVAAARGQLDALVASITPAS
jgi:hypothetical protein